MQKLFITSSGTDIGKTFITTALCWQARQQGRKVMALKPVVSGYDPKDRNSDTSLILQSCGIEPTEDSVAAISPWRYKAALAPNMAAAREGNPVDMEKLATFCRSHEQMPHDVLIVEGVGGVMAPMTDTHTMLGWINRMAWPLVLVGGSYLGSISHTLTAAEVLAAHRAVIRAIVISESKDSTVSLEETVATLEKFLPDSIPVIPVPRLVPQEALWTKLPSLARLYTL